MMPPESPYDQRRGKRISAEGIRGLAREVDKDRDAFDGTAKFIGQGGGGQIMPLEGWSFGTVTSSCGTGANATYGWQVINADTRGNSSVTEGVLSGTTGAGTASLPGINVAYMVTSEDLEVGDPVLIRPGPQAGGAYYELIPVNSNGTSPPPPPPPSPGGAGSGWGLVAGLQPLQHCFQANVTTGYQTGLSSCIGNQTLTMVWNGTQSGWVTGNLTNVTQKGNLAFCCGNKPLLLTVSGGQPFLTLIGNGANGCNNQTLNNYSFSYDGTTSVSLSNGTTADTIFFRGGSRTLANGSFLSNMPSTGNSVPTAYLNTFGVELKLIYCSNVVCPTCPNMTLPTPLYLTFANAALGNCPGMAGISVRMDFYPNGNVPQGAVDATALPGLDLWVGNLTPYSNSNTTLWVAWEPCSRVLAAGNVTYPGGIVFNNAALVGNITTCNPYLVTLNNWDVFVGTNGVRLSNCPPSGASTKANITITQ